MRAINTETLREERTRLVKAIEMMKPPEWDRVHAELAEVDGAINVCARLGEEVDPVSVAPPVERRQPVAASRRPLPRARRAQSSGDLFTEVRRVLRSFEEGATAKMIISSLANIGLDQRPGPFTRSLNSHVEKGHLTLVGDRYFLRDEDEHHTQANGPQEHRLHAAEE